MMQKKKSSIVIISVLLVVLLSGCKKPVVKHVIKAHNTTPLFSSFWEIPGVTAAEIASIEALQKEHKTLIYGISMSTEAFITENGEIGGYAALLCDWLSGLFGISIKPAIFDKNELNQKLDNGEIQFAGEPGADGGLPSDYFLTSSITERNVKMIRLNGSKPLLEIAKERPLRLLFVNGFFAINIVKSTFEYGDFDSAYVDGYEQAYGFLKNGNVDAFFCAGGDEIAFIAHDDITVSDYLPLINQPVFMTAKDKTYKPIITVMQKALYNGAFDYLRDLHRQGHEMYLRYALFLRLTEEEQEFIRDNPIIYYVTQTLNYPRSFYDQHRKEWRGAAFDILNEVEALSGLSFKRLHGDEYIPWSELLAFVENGQAAFITDLTRTDARKGKFLFSDPLYRMHFILASRNEQRNYSFNEVRYLTVGVVKNTAQTEAFKRWFPGHQRIVEYNDTNLATDALGRGEVDLVMMGTDNLLSLMNYQEVSGYRANIIFDNVVQEGCLGFYINQDVLCSIMNKAFKFINTDEIVNDWEGIALDYSYKLIQAQRPWLIGACALFAGLLALLFAFFQKKSHEGRALEEIVKSRTSDLSRMNKNLGIALQDAEAANRAKSAFLANMSHEMRTPMNVIVGLTDLMLEEEELTNIIENLNKINTAGNSLLGLINDILDISKIEAGKLEITPVQYDVASLLNDVITLNITRISDKPISFRLDITKDLPCTLYGDDLRVKQIANNLLSNAFKYTLMGTVTLGVSCTREGNEDIWMSIYVSDTGIGIRKDDMEKLFSDYNQVDTRANRKVEGTGLGLSLTKKLVELMGGEISVESEYGVGTMFRLRIRQRFVDNKTIGVDTTENLCSFHYTDSRKRAYEKIVRSNLAYARVLVVDDMQTNLDVAMGMLRKYKMQVDCVLSGGEAIDRMAAGNPLYDAIFMDHMMPEMDGMEATARIRNLGTEYAQKIPIIALTANAIAGNEQLFLNNGFQAFLTKPINIINLDSIVNHWVRDKSKE